MAGRKMDFSDPAWRDTTATAAMEEVIRRGKGRMKGYDEKLTEVEIGEVLAYLHELAPLRRDSRMEEGK
jgi:hypothetical protein